jgi:hypothetical protein
MQGSCAAVYTGEVDRCFANLTDETQFYLNGHSDTQNNRHWSVGNP